MKTLSIATALAALVLAAPAFGDPGSTALYPETVAGAGLNGVAGASHTIVRQLTGHGVAAGVAFRVSPSRVSFGQFRSLKVSTVKFGLNSVHLTGVGLLDGRRVTFSAVGVHNARPEIDLFHIAWNRGASIGGVVTKGLVFIR